MKSIKRKRNMKISLVLDMQVPYIVDIVIYGLRNR